MKTKREIDIVLLTFAISTIVWCVAWSFIVGKLLENC